MARPKDEAKDVDAQSAATSVRRKSLRGLFTRRKSRYEPDDSRRPSTMASYPSNPPPEPEWVNHVVKGGDTSAAVEINAPADQIEGKKKSLIMNAFVEMCSGHQSPGLWRHREDQSHRFNQVKYWMDLAKLLEAGKFHGMFIADVLGGYDVYGGPNNLEPAIRAAAQWPVNEPLAVVPAMAAVTENLGFGVTVSTTYEQPYHLARRISTVDHLTNGRVAWNVVTGYLDSAARNLGRGSEQPSHEERYAVCEEYMRVVYSLWQSSWRSDAVVRNRYKGIYTNPQRVRQIDHEGKYYTVPGPHICQPSPQRTPVIFQAGASSSGKAFAARHAEAVFISGHSPPACAKNVKDIREQAVKEGRDPYSIKILAKICPVLAETHEEAEEKYKELLSYGDEEGALSLFGGWTGVDMANYGEEEELQYVESNAIRSYIEGLMKTSPKTGKWTKKTLAEHIIVGGLGATPVGTPAEVADEFERWVDEADVDGFNIAYALMPGTFNDVIEMLLPELRRRGLFWDDYAFPGCTYRENLTLKKGQNIPADDHPAAKFLWAAGESKESLERRLQTISDTTTYYKEEEKARESQKTQVQETRRQQQQQPQPQPTQQQQKPRDPVPETPSTELAHSMGFSVAPRPNFSQQIPYLPRIQQSSNVAKSQPPPEASSNLGYYYKPGEEPPPSKFLSVSTNNESPTSKPATQPLSYQQAHYNPREQQMPDNFRSIPSHSGQTPSNPVPRPSYEYDPRPPKTAPEDPNVDWDTWANAASMSSLHHSFNPNTRNSPPQNNSRDPYAGYVQSQQPSHFPMMDPSLDMQGQGSFSLGPFWSRRDFSESQPTLGNYPSTIGTASEDGDDYQSKRDSFPNGSLPGAWQESYTQRGPYSQSYHNLSSAQAVAKGKSRGRSGSSGDIDELKERVARQGLAAVLEENGYLDPTAVQIS